MTAAELINSFPACKGLIPTKDEYEYYCDKYDDPEYSIRKALCEFDCSVLNQEERNKVYLRFMSRSSSMDIKMDALSILMKFDDLRRAERRFRECPGRNYYKQLVSIASIIVVKRIILLYYNIPVVIDPDRRSFNITIGKVTNENLEKAVKEDEGTVIVLDPTDNINHLKTRRINGSDYYVDFFYVMEDTNGNKDMIEAWIYDSRKGIKIRAGVCSLSEAGSISNAIDILTKDVPRKIKEYNSRFTT